jgi:hypothetical protein
MDELAALVGEAPVVVLVEPDRVCRREVRAGEPDPVDVLRKRLAI